MTPVQLRVLLLAAWQHRRAVLVATLLPLAVVGGALTIVAALLTAGSASVAISSTACATRNDPLAVTPADAPDVTVANLDSAQLRNAATVVKVGAERGVPRQGWVIALATALQESRLRDYASTVYPETLGDPRAEAVGSDHDSVGIFQQRPAAGWGTPRQLLDPAYAASAFYGGPQPPANPGLLDNPLWQLQPLTMAAQSVQRSAFPDAVGQWEPLARDLVDALQQSGSIPSAATSPATAAGGGCAFETTAATGAGAVFGDGSAVQRLPRANPRTVEQAIAWARHEASAPTRPNGWYRLCSAFVAHAYGWHGSGVTYALDQWRDVMPQGLQHPHDRSPAPGALLFWDTGKRAGHVALYLGDGLIASNDIVTNGRISVVPASAIEQRWGSTYLGWSAPYFARAG